MNYIFITSLCDFSMLKDNNIHDDNSVKETGILDESKNTKYCSKI